MATLDKIEIIDGIKYTFKRDSSERVNFICDRCKKNKVSKIYVTCELPNGKTTKICNGCYGFIHSRAKDIRLEDIKRVRDIVIKDEQNKGAVFYDVEKFKTVVFKENEIVSEESNDKNFQEKKHQLMKLDMVLNQISPIAIQHGIGLFKNYYIYYYESGMVALDKIGYGSALYIMPAHIYKEVRNKKNLFEVRTVPGVRFIVHKNDNWLLSARDYIENGTKGLTENDIRESELIASIDFPYTISGLEKLKQELELEGKYSGKLQNEIERRESKAKSLLEIDDELRSDIEDDVISLSNEEFNDEVDKLSSTGILDFNRLYKYWKNHCNTKKMKRNPVVASITKERARDEDGNYCCELCGNKAFESSAFDSHHMIPLNAGGIDNIYNTICLCPGCHRNYHLGKVTNYQKSIMFSKIRQHIIELNPEYLQKFEKMISPIATNDEEYLSNKDVIDNNFSILWNGENPKLR